MSVDVFICWSGDRSKRVAEVLRDWLPSVIQSVRPWMADEDLRKGTNWPRELSEKLAKTNYGIVCLTEENLLNEWIMFEAGALSKQIEGALVAPFLLGVEKDQISGPLATFQLTEAIKEDTYKLVKSVNEAQEMDKLDNVVLRKVYNKWWPDLEEQITKALEIPIKEEKRTDQRTQKEILGELLARVRELPRELEARLGGPAETRKPEDLRRKWVMRQRLYEGIDELRRKIDEIVDHLLMNEIPPETVEKFARTLFLLESNRPTGQYAEILTEITRINYEDRAKLSDVITNFTSFDNATEADVKTAIYDLGLLAGKKPGSPFRE